jgi:hypothetical protein
MQHIKKIYLYAVSLIALVIMVIASITLINLALKTWVFTKADIDYYKPVPCDQRMSVADPNIKQPVCNYEQELKDNEDRRSGDKQREVSNSLAMLIVAIPVFYYHWKLARKEA